MEQRRLLHSKVCSVEEDEDNVMVQAHVYAHVHTHAHTSLTFYNILTQVHICTHALGTISGTGQKTAVHKEA